MNDDRINVWVQRQAGRKLLRLQWHDPESGRRKSKSAGTDDPAFAETARADLECMLNRGLHDEPSKLSWDRFREQYEAEKVSGDGKSNRERALSVLESFETTMRPKRIGDVTERTPSAYSVKLRERNLKPTTIKVHLTYLKVMLRWAADQHILPRAPKVIMPKIPKGANKAKIRAAARITTEEFERLLSASPNDGWRLLIAFAWHCGMRRREARSVGGAHVDMDGHLIGIPSNKGGDMSAQAFITPDLDAMLQEMFPDGIPSGPLVKAVPNQPERISMQFSAIAAKASVKGNGKDGYCTLHDLRRNYGSRWAVKVPAQVLRGMMRHATLTTTFDFYAETESQTVGILWGEAGK